MSYDSNKQFKKESFPSFSFAMAAFFEDQGLQETRPPGVFIPFVTVADVIVDEGYTIRVKSRLW